MLEDNYLIPHFNLRTVLQQESDYGFVTSKCRAVKRSAVSFITLKCFDRISFFKKN